MGLGPVEIDEGSQNYRDFDLGPSEDVVDEDRKGRSLRVS
jgi:hypothetical protein